MRTTRFDDKLLAVAVAQAGAVAARQLVPIHGTYAQLRTRVAAGRLRREKDGLYVHAEFPRTWKQDLWLAHLDAGDRSAICGRAAARLHGIRGHTAPVVEVEVRQGGSHRAIRGRVHETFWLPPTHLTKVDGLPVTNIARTVFDLAGSPKHPLAFRIDALRDIHVRQTTRLINDAIRDHGLTMRDLASVLAAVGRRGKPGTSIIRTIVGDLGVDYAPGESELEDLFIDFCAAFGFDAPERQVELGTAREWIGRVDFLFRGQRVIVELDGRGHLAPLEARADRRRDAALRAEGWTIVRITWWELVHEPENVAARLRRTFAASAVA
jgi:hypothetical protein